MSEEIRIAERLFSEFLKDHKKNDFVEIPMKEFMNIYFPLFNKDLLSKLNSEEVKYLSNRYYARTERGYKKVIVTQVENGIKKIIYEFPRRFMSLSVPEDEVFKNMSNRNLIYSNHDRKDISSVVLRDYSDFFVKHQLNDKEFIDKVAMERINTRRMVNKIKGIHEEETPSSDSHDKFEFEFVDE